MSVVNKTQMYDLMRKGQFGNHFQIYHSLEEIIASGCKGIFAIRSGRVAGLHSCVPGVPFEKLSNELNKFKYIDEAIIQQVVPDEHKVLQGHFVEYPDGALLEYTFEKDKLPTAFAKECHTAKGLKAFVILARFMNEASFDDFKDLLESFPEHIIEFSIYDHCVGNCPGRNTIIWECRRY